MTLKKPGLVFMGLSQGSDKAGSKARLLGEAIRNARRRMDGGKKEGKQNRCLREQQN